MSVPKVPAAMSAPHSPLALKLFRSQSGLKLPLSVHGRDESVCNRRIGFGASVTCAAPKPVVPRPSRYLFSEIFHAVLPVPNTSYVADRRGVTSFQLRFF